MSASFYLPLQLSYLKGIHYSKSRCFYDLQVSHTITYTQYPSNHKRRRHRRPPYSYNRPTLLKPHLGAYGWTPGFLRTGSSFEDNSSGHNLRTNPHWSRRFQPDVCRLKPPHTWTFSYQKSQAGMFYKWIKRRRISPVAEFRFAEAHEQHANRAFGSLRTILKSKFTNNTALSSQMYNYAARNILCAQTLKGICLRTIISYYISTGYM